jgi:hypothetical protein
VGAVQTRGTSGAALACLWQGTVMNWFDLGLAALVVILVASGIREGLSRSGFGLLAVVVAFLSAAWLYPANPRCSLVVSFAVVARLRLARSFSAGGSRVPVRSGSPTPWRSLSWWCWPCGRSRRDCRANRLNAPPLPRMRSRPLSDLQILRSPPSVTTTGFVAGPSCARKRIGQAAT